MSDGNVELLRQMVEIIKSKTGLTQAKIGERCHYNKNYITQRISANKVSDDVIAQMKLVFAKELNGELLDGLSVAEEAEKYFKTLSVKESVARLLESNYRVEARQAVMRNYLAELYAKQAKLSVADVLAQMESLEIEAVKELRHQL
jgi:hypothetical protein